MMKISNIVISAIAFLFTGISIGQEIPKLGIAQLPSLPAQEEGKASLGFAGMVGGFDNDVMIAAGGANFPNALPWEGGKKIYSDKIYVLNGGQWQLSEQTLPKPLAYGASVSLPEGILIIGGENENQTSDHVFLVSYDTSNDNVVITDYPPLPEPLAYTDVVVEESYAYVVGGKNAERSVNSFYRLALDGKQQWEKLTDFPGTPRALHAITVQETQDSRKLFVIGGRNQTAGKKSEPLTDYLSYDLKEGTWQNEGKVLINGKPRVLMGASADPMGSMHIMVYGGSDEVLFDELENLGLQLGTVKNDSLKKQLIARRDNILNHHPGFSKDILGYNSITKKWFVYDSLPNQIPVTALSFKKDDEFFIVSGEISPGIRTPKVQKYKIAEAAEPFGVINYTVLALYLLISLMIGVYFARKQKSTEDYFVGGGRIPWWASGLSVFGTLLSAITFMAIPAKAFITDWSFFFLNITAILITPVIAFIFIPFFNKLKIRTAYEYLEDRFNYLARAIASLSFILFQLGRKGIVLLLPSLAISIVTGIPVETSILIMGVLCILYTTFGGIEAVIWTQVS